MRAVDFETPYAYLDAYAENRKFESAISRIGEIVKGGTLWDRYI
jgi:hypothetical protein